MKSKSSTRNTSSAVTDTVQNFDAMPSSAFVRLPTVCALFGISRATAWRWVKTGQLPTPRRLGPRVCGFQVSALRKIMQQEKTITE